MYLCYSCLSACKWVVHIVVPSHSTGKVGTNGYYGRGVARKRTGDKRGACKDWMKCSELGCVQANVLLPLCDRDLIRLIEEYAGSLDAFSDIENISLYLDLSIYGEDADELLSKYSSLFNVSMNEFHFNDYFPEEGDEISGFIKGLFKGKEKKYKLLTIEGLQQGIINKKLN